MDHLARLRSRESLSEMSILSTMLIYGITGGTVAFALRGAVYAVGFKDNMFSYFHDFVSWSMIMEDGMKSPGTYLVFCLAFSGFVIAFLYGCSRLKRGSSDGRV